eukprot:s203_g5.t1
MPGTSGLIEWAPALRSEKRSRGHSCGALASIPTSPLCSAVTLCLLYTKLEDKLDRWNVTHLFRCFVAAISSWRLRLRPRAYCLIMFMAMRGTLSMNSVTSLRKLKANTVSISHDPSYICHLGDHSYHIFGCCSLNPLFGLPRLQSTAFDVSPPDLPAEWGHAPPVREPQSTHITFRLSLATANVLSLGRGESGYTGKLAYLRTQFCSLHLNLLGIQEGRANEGSSTVRGVLRLCSGADQGQGGDQTPRFLNEVTIDGNEEARDTPLPPDIDANVESSADNSPVSSSVATSWCLAELPGPDSERQETDVQEPVETDSQPVGLFGGPDIDLDFDTEMPDEEDNSAADDACREAHSSQEPVTAAALEAFDREVHQAMMSAQVSDGLVLCSRNFQIDLRRRAALVTP